MPADRLVMRQIKDILRLRHDAGLSLREIARSLNLSVGVVSKYLQLAAAAGIGWPPPADLDEDALALKLQPAPAANLPTTPLPNFAELHQELRRKGVTLQLLWEEYAQANPIDHYSYSHLCVLYREWRHRLSPTMRQTHAPGDKLFVDYCGPTVPVIDALSGEVREANIFVAVLGASNYTYAEATFTQQLHDWVRSHVRAFEFFGGVPRLLVPDYVAGHIIREPLEGIAVQDHKGGTGGEHARLLPKRCMPIHEPGGRLCDCRHLTAVQLRNDRSAAFACERRRKGCFPNRARALQKDYAGVIYKTS